MASLISKLKKRKAPAWDKLTSEHLQFSCKTTKSVIVWVMNGIIKSNSFPVDFKKGVLIPIPKANKDSSLKENNRGITLLPVLYKLFEKNVIERESVWAESNISEIQSCGKQHISCLHTSFILQQAIAHNVNQGETIYGAFLDTQKAFDTVWINGLLWKLYESGINPKLWLLIRDAYSDFKCSVMMNGEIDQWFYARRGVHQGAPLSMILYTVYINDLLTELTHARSGLHLYDVNVTNPAHADDLALLALSKKGLNELLVIAYRYSLKWRYTYNLSKTALMIWGPDNDPHLSVNFGNEILEKKSSCKHMGVTLVSETNMNKDVYTKRVGAGRQMLHASRGLGSTSMPVMPNVLSKIYWSVSVPKMTYGLEVSPISDSCIEILEKAHRYHANILQNLPQCTPRPAPLATLGWLSMEAYIATIQIMFLVRVLCLDPKSIYRRAMLICVQNIFVKGKVKEKMLSPVASMVHFVERYGLENMIKHLLTYGNWNNVKQIKGQVKRVIWEFEVQRWKASCIM